MSQHLRSQVEEDKEGAAVNLQSTRVREVFKYLPDWAPKTEDASAQDPILSPDVTLNAFAQLVALRMGVDRSMISFLDGEEQYVLAEATKTSPLQRGRLDKVGDELMTGVRTIASGQGLCYQALAQVPVDGILIVENIHESKDFCLRPFAQSAPDVKFYAACPIVINDEKVGILCVIDHNARETVTTEEVSFLCDVASSVAQHLETMRMKRTRDRTVDIVAALDAVMRPGHKIRSSRASLKKTNARVFGQPIKNSQDVVGKGHDPRQEESIEPNVEFRSPAPPGSSSNFLEYAGSLLVDGFNADGVVFYDAGSRIYTAGISRRDTDYSTSSSGFPTTPQELIVPGHKGEILQAIDSPACKILAFSSSKDLFDDSNPIGNLQEHNLRDLLEMFPTGKVLHVGDAGLSVDKSIAEPLRQISPEPGHIRADQCLIEAMPNAQNIIFFPLWDHCRERWYAGGFLYSNDAKRLVFTEEDLNFLRAFALVLTGELANRDRERSHIQKETFISMISHELRTPLHGILSNVDLMKDVGLSTFQSTLLDTISACGHSLMDIINHLIDRSTMASTEDNYKKHYRLSEKHRQAPLKRETSYDKLEAVDLVVLTEEVINALAIEMHLRAEVRQGYETALQSSSSSEAQDLLPSYAVIIYDIYPQYDWSVRVRKGAFRRLLANLTSNAIKFTREGTIKISLQRQEPTDSNLSCLVNLDIEDTGEGISDDFLKHHLFQQFKQENARTIGSGLGLHIVKSMVDELQGKIDIRSSKGFGTSVSISFPCELTTWNGNQDLGSPLDYADPVLQQVKSEGHRLTAYFVSSDEDQRPWHKRVALDHSKESISRICRNWFGIKIEASTGLKAGPGIINFVDESFLDSRPFSEILVDMARDLEWNESGKIFTSPILIVGTINFTAALQSQSSFKAKNMFSITNPCGPYQLARVLLSCMSLILTDFEPKKTALSVESTLSGLSLSGSTEDSDNGQSYDRVAPRAQSHKIVATSNTDSMVKQSDDQESKITTNMISTWERKPHMLLVEDNAVNMKVLERLCNRLSLSYALAFNGLEAVKLFEADSSIFDIIWMDIMMPVMDGIAATKQIRDIEKKSGRYERKNRARIVALTGLSGEDIEKDAESVGFDAFWTKPVKLDLLRREVDRWAQVRERHEEQLSRNVSAESQQSSGSS